MSRKYLLSLLCWLPVCSHALSISGVSHVPKALDTSKNNSVTIQYALDESAQVTLNIFDDRELLIRKIDSADKLKPGTHQFVWDGRDQANRPVPAEAYHYTLVAKNGKDTVEHDLSDFTGGVVVAVQSLEWNPTTQMLSYSILRPARVNIRVGFKNNGPLMATLVDWLPKKHGAHSLR